MSNSRDCSPLISHYHIQVLLYVCYMQDEIYKIRVLNDEIKRKYNSGVDSTLRAPPPTASTGPGEPQVTVPKAPAMPSLRPPGK